METAAQARFWETLSTELMERHAKENPDLVTALKDARAVVAGDPFEAVAAGLIQKSEQGQSLSQAMSLHKDVFPAGVTAMIRAGETGGTLYVAAWWVSQAVQKGLFHLADQPAKAEPLLRFWGIMGIMVSASVPLLQVLYLLQEEMTRNSQVQLAEAAGAMRQATLNGQTIAKAMRSFPQLFDPRIVVAVDAGESGGQLASAALRIADALEKDNLDDLPVTQPIPEGTDAAKMSGIFLDILQEALSSRASDLGFESLEGGRVRVRQRIDGVMHDMRTLPAGSAPSLINRIKMLAKMDVAEHRLPQDGQMHMVLGYHGKVDIRISTVPGVYGERLMMRILRREAVALGLDKVGLSDENLATLRRFAHMPQGIVVVNGPTGTGKTTLLYSMLLEIDAVANTIITVEDPVEFAFDRFTQIQVRPEIGLTFSRAIRSMLRQAPNVIMIGEIRDQEMLQFSVQAAMTGHLVMTTLHATTSPGAIRRMLDIGVAPFMLNSSLIGVISQKLVRLLCPECKQPVRPDELLLPAEVRQALQPHKDVTWFGPEGCPACTNTGYRGMTAIHEVLVIDDAIRQVVSTDPTATRVHEVAIQQGMKTMLEDGLVKAALGMTSVDEILRVVPQSTYQ